MGVNPRITASLTVDLPCPWSLYIHRVSWQQQIILYCSIYCQNISTYTWSRPAQFQLSLFKGQFTHMYTHTYIFICFIYIYIYNLYNPYIFNPSYDTWGKIYWALEKSILCWHHAIKVLKHNTILESLEIGNSLKVWMEKAMATHSSTVARKIPWMEEPGRLQSMGSRRVRHDWATSLSLSTFMHWRRKWQPTPVFLPGESHRRRSLVGCSPWGCTELDTTEGT